MTASDVQDAGYGVGEHGNGQGGGGCKHRREFVTPVGVESPAWWGGPNETEVVEDFAVVDEVVSGLVLGWAWHIESFQLVSYTMDAKIASISIYYNMVCYKTQGGEPSIYAGCGVFQGFIIDIFTVFGELREGKFLRRRPSPRGRVGGSSEKFRRLSIVQKVLSVLLYYYLKR
jgi:hypothetical protein